MVGSAGANLLGPGLVIFGVGVGLNYLGGEAFRIPALVVQLVGVGFLFANAARSRREAREPDEDPPDGSDPGVR